MAGSHYWFIKLAWINVINATSHSFAGKRKEDVFVGISVQKLRGYSRRVERGT